MSMFDSEFEDVDLKDGENIDGELKDVEELNHEKLEDDAWSTIKQLRQALLLRG